MTVLGRRAQTASEQGRVVLPDDQKTTRDTSRVEEIQPTGRASNGAPLASPGRVNRGHSKVAKRLKRRLMFADALAVVIGVALAFGVQALVRPVPSFVVIAHTWLALASVPAFIFGAGMTKLYHARANERPLEEARNVLKAVATGMSGLVLLALLAQYNDLSRLWVITVTATITASLIVERSIARAIFRRLRRNGTLTRRIVIVGTDSHAIALMHAYDRDPSSGYEVVGFVGDDVQAARGDISVLGDVKSLPQVLVDANAGGVVVSLGSVSDEEVNYLTRNLTDSGYHVAVSSSLRDIDISRLRTQHVDGQTLIYVERTIRHGWRSAAKRIFDIAFAVALLIATIPFQVIAAIAIKATSSGPVFFRQLRVGKDGELFEMIKFRTMGVDAEAQKASLAHLNEADGALFKIENDPRVTKVGRVLRKYSIDELPQLYCIILGTMSAVGPRPALPDEVEQWDPEVKQRLKVLPGLTGLWQVSGRSDTSFEEYSRLDISYVDNWSLLHDLRICFKTVWIVLRGSGAS